MVVKPGVRLYARGSEAGEVVQRALPQVSAVVHIGTKAYATRSAA